MKKIISIICLLMALAMLAIPAFAVSGSVSLSASSKTLYRGDTFTVTASLSSSDAIALGTVALNFDSSVFELTGGSCHVSGASIGQVIPGNKAGTFMFSGDPQVVSGKIFTFNLKVKDNAPIGNFTISSSSSIGVSSGEGISSGSVSVTVTCDHTYGAWSENDSVHEQTCSKCGNVNTESHKWNSGSVSKPANCKEEGLMTYVCTVCNASKTEPISKTDDHVFGNLTAVDAANHKDTCSVCQKEITESHSWDNGKVTKPATCKEEGAKTITCTGCKYSKTEKIDKTTDHSYGAWQKIDENTHKHICSVCSKEETAAHSWNNGSVTKKATCKEEGEKTYTCTGCKTTKTEVIPLSTTHSWSKWSKVDADTHKRTCTVCDKEESGNHSYKTSWSKDRNNHWHECSVCGNKKDEAKHIPGAEPTETTPQTCKTCNYIIKAALGHTHDYDQAWTQDENGHWYACAGCEEKGEYAEHDFENACDTDCATCGYIREAGHNYSVEWVQDAENHWHTCSGCGDIQDQEAHIPGLEATETTAQTCTICNFEIAPALGVPETEPVPELTTPPAATEPVVNNGDNAKFPWWIIVVVVAVVAIPAVVLIVRKRKH